MHTPLVSIVEIFSAPQGEGGNAGRHAVFIRLAGCNLRCEFAPGVVCDTPYQNVYDRFTVSELLDRAGVCFSYPIPALVSDHERPMLVITGGEPTLCKSFGDLVECAMERGWYIAVETNGTRWLPSLEHVHWLTVSPKDDVEQTSEAPGHNRVRNPNSKVDELIIEEMKRRADHRPGLIGKQISGEYRYVISPDSKDPLYLAAPFHYVSPAVLSDGSGLEWQQGFPGFVPGAVDRCLGIIRKDPRWRISVQVHKVLGVR